MNMKKIVHVQVIPKMSGVQTVSYEILKGLSNDNFDKYIICGTEGGDEKFFEDFEAIGVKVIKIPSLTRSIGVKDLIAFRELFRCFKKYRFDIVHTNSTKPGIIARIAARLAGAPNVVHTVHGIAYHKFEHPIKRCIYYLIELMSSLFSNHIVLVNKYYKRFYGFIPFVNIKTIYNGVNFSGLDEKTKVDSDEINILFFARLDAQKNPMHFLKAIKYIVENKLICNLDYCKFTVTGEGELRAECEAYVKDNNLSSWVVFTGWSVDKSRSYNSADILCVPSIYEAFGLIFVEAAHFGIPAISTRVEGIPEVVKDNETGILVEPNDVPGLAHSISKLVNDRSLRIELGQSAKARSYEFTVDNMVSEYVCIYNSK